MPITVICSMVEDVRTRWYAGDPEFMEMVAALRRLISLVEPADTAHAA